MGDSVPDVKMMDPTPSLENSSIAIPGLKHHQLNVLDVFPEISHTNSSTFIRKHALCFHTLSKLQEKNQIRKQSSTALSERSNFQIKMD